MLSLIYCIAKVVTKQIAIVAKLLTCFNRHEITQELQNESRPIFVLFIGNRYFSFKDARLMGYM